MLCSYLLFLEEGSIASVPQVLAMSDIMAGTTLEDLEYSDEEDELQSDEDDIDQVRHNKQKTGWSGVLLVSNCSVLTDH